MLESIVVKPHVPSDDVALVFLRFRARLLKQGRFKKIVSIKEDNVGPRRFLQAPIARSTRTNAAQSQNVHPISP